MKKLIAFCLLIPSLLSAQPTHIDSLEARVALLEQIVNANAFRSGPQIPCSEMEAHRPASWFANGHYDISFTMKQVQCGTNDLARHVDDDDRAVTSFAAKLPLDGRTVPAYVNDAIASIANSNTGSRVDTVVIVKYDTIIVNSGGGGGGGGNLVSTSDITGGGHYAAIGSGSLDLKANTVHNSTQSGITSQYCGYIQMNGWDGGLRIKQNTAEAACTPELPSMYYGGDSHATWSYWQGPEAIKNIPASQTYGQSLIIDGGWAQSGYNYFSGSPLSRGILFAAQRQGEGLLFAVTPQRAVGQYPTNKVVLHINSDGSDSPVEMVAGGVYGRVKLCNINGVQVLCF